jgi:hypothetical protein
MFNNVFSENLPVFEITWKNIAEPGRPQMNIQFAAFALHAG